MSGYNSPFSACGGASLVDARLGDAYNVVKYVADNMATLQELLVLLSNGDISIPGGGGGTDVDLGRADADSSLPFALSTEDFNALTGLAALIGLLNSAAAADETATTGINGLLKALLRDYRARTPELGPQLRENSQSITLASDHPAFQVTGNVLASFEGDAPLSNEELRAEPVVTNVIPITTAGDFLNTIIADGGTAQTLLSVNPNRLECILINTSNDDLWWSDRTDKPAAVGVGQPISKGRAIGITGSAAQRAHTIVGATTGQSYVVRWEVLA